MKTPLLIGIILSLLFLAMLAFFLLQESPSTSSRTFSVKGIHGEKINIRDIYKEAVEVRQGSYVLIKRNEWYDMLYYPQDQSFLITLSKKPLQEARDRAQADFLESLGITGEEACKLQVSFTIPGFVDSEASGKDYHLSFCPDGVSLP